MSGKDEYARDSSAPDEGGRLRRILRRLLIALGVAVAAGAALPWGCVGNRMFNPRPEDSLRTAETAEGVPWAVAVVEFDDQGEPWDVRQLENTLALIRSFNRASEDGVVLYQFIHGWKRNASWETTDGVGLPWFSERVAAIAERSGQAAADATGPPRPVVGLYVGWRGRTYSLPILIDASFWNRRVAAHRVASVRLAEVLQRTVAAAKENPHSKTVLLGHSMGGLVLERTLGPALLDSILAAERRAVPMEYDLVVSANPAIGALYTSQLVDILKRSGVRLVLEVEDGTRQDAGGPLLASITSEADGVTRWIFPFAMGVNSLFVRYRGAGGGSLPSQRRLGLHTAGWVPQLHSHTVEVVAGDVVVHELPGRWNDTPLWVFRVPSEVSSGHSDIATPLWGRLMMQLMERNQVFDPDLGLRMVGPGAGARP